MNSLVWHHVLADKCIFHSFINIFLENAFQVTDCFHAILWMALHLFATVNSVLHVACLHHAGYDFSDHFLVAASGMSIPEQTFILNRMRQYILKMKLHRFCSLLIKGAGKKRKSRHLSTTNMKHIIPAGKFMLHVTLKEINILHICLNFFFFFPKFKIQLFKVK